MPSVTVAKHKSTSVPKDSDQRVVRTRDQIDRAFIELLHRRNYAGIRVSDIVRKARVGRATFYAHYESKDDLLRSQLQRLVMHQLRALPNALWPLDCTPMFAHIREAPHIYKSLSSSKVLQDCLEERIEQIFAAAFPRKASEVPIAARVHVMAASLRALFSWWLENGTRQSPQEMQVICETLLAF